MKCTTYGKMSSLNFCFINNKMEIKKIVLQTFYPSFGNLDTLHSFIECSYTNENLTKYK